MSGVIHPAVDPAVDSAVGPEVTAATDGSSASGQASRLPRCQIDIDAIRRMALRTPSCPRAGTLVQQLDCLLEHGALGRVLVVAQALAAAATVDASAAEMLRVAGLVGQIRAEAGARKALPATDQAPIIDGRKPKVAAPGVGRG
jgi:hypothetical protein